MLRRLFSGLLGSGSAGQARKAARAQQQADWRARALANFPFEVVETSGEGALATWEELKSAGRGVPVVVGKDVESVLGPFDPEERWPKRPVSEILSAAEAIRFPEDLFLMRRNEAAVALAAMRKRDPSFRFDEHDPPLGEWPAEVSHSPGLSVAHDFRTGQPLSKVQIVLIPTDDPTTVPAHLFWGHWNACPAPEFHIAALRHWRDRYGAELVGIENDTLNIRVARRPAAREEALELARVQYAYCDELIGEGYETYSAVAADLMAHDWWFFWWD
jgi:hypothetical protein